METGDVDVENTYSVPILLILKREYILIKTTIMAIETSVQKVANNDPPLFWLPPRGTGSEAIRTMVTLRIEVHINQTRKEV